MSLTKLIHVVELSNGCLISITSFSSDRVTEAQDLFKSHLRSNINENFTDKECEEFIEEGYAESDGYAVNLTWGKLG
jgi:hypothetical protein